MDIQEFLLARIAEDEATARDAIDPSGWGSSPDGRWRFEEVAYQGEWPRNPEPHADHDPELITWADSKWTLHANRHDPARVLRECAAKRAIMDIHDVVEFMGGKTICSTCAEWDESEVGEGPPSIPFPCETLKVLTAIYADHPDYQQEWSL